MEKLKKIFKAEFYYFIEMIKDNFNVFMDYRARKHAEYNLNIVKDGYGWAMAQHRYKVMSINQLIGYYESARANNTWHPFYDGVKEAVAHLKGIEQRKKEFYFGTGLRWNLQHAEYLGPMLSKGGYGAILDPTA